MANPQFDSLARGPGYRFAPAHGKKPVARQQKRANPSLTTESEMQLAPGMSAVAHHDNPDEAAMVEQRGINTEGGPGPIRPDHSLRTGIAHPHNTHMSAMKIHAGSSYSKGAPEAGRGKADMHMPFEEYVAAERNLKRSDNTSKMHGASPGRHDITEHHNEPAHAGEEKWIKGAIRRPGRMKRAAKRAGMSTHGYMQKHAQSPGSLGAAARLGLRLSGMAKRG